MGFKSRMHDLCRRFGFDIVQVGNLELEVEKRIAARVRARNVQMQDIRTKLLERHLARDSNQGTCGGGTVWVGREVMFLEAAGRLSRAETVIDIGCGIRPQQMIEARTHICCEPCPDYMERLIGEHGSDPKYVFLGCDLAQALSLFPPASVDTVVLLDVIEHLEKGVAKELLSGLSRIARAQVVVFTPLGFMPQHFEEQDEDHWGLPGAKWQEHRSGWIPEDFPPEHGWSVVACKEFHTEDVHGNRLDPACGALWAIQNIS